MVYDNNILLKETVTDKSTIPSDVLSFSEAALYVCEGIEKDYGKLFEDIGIHELAVYESTGELISYVSEADSEEPSAENKKLHERIIEWLKSIWAKIKGFFENAMAKFKSFIDNNKKKMNESSAAKLSKADLSKLPNDKKFGTVYDYKAFDDARITDSYDSRVQKVMSSISAQFDDLSPDAEGANELYEKFKENMLGNYMGGKSIEGNTAEDLKKYYKGLIPEKAIEVDKNYLSSNFDTMVKYVFTDNSISDLKKMYKVSRKAIDLATSAAKKRMNAAKKNDKVISYAQYEYRLYKDIIQYVVAENGVLLDILRKRMSDYRGVVFRVALSGKKNGSFKESSDDLFASQVAMVEGAFPW